MRVNAVVNGKCDRFLSVCKMADNGQLTVDQKVKVVCFMQKQKCGSDTEKFSCTLW